MEIVIPPEKDETMIEELLKFKSKIDEIHRRSFKSNENIEITMRKSFQFAINQRENRPSELLAKFLDAKLKSSKSVCFFLFILFLIIYFYLFIYLFLFIFLIFCLFIFYLLFLFIYLFFFIFFVYFVYFRLIFY